MTTRRLLVVAHCILNPHSAIHGGTQHRNLARRLVNEAMARDIGVVQLPCPETTLLGARRWAQSYDQYDTPWYRDHCERLVEGPVRQFVDHQADDTRLVAIVGIAGSPSCGVHQTICAPFGGLIPGMPGAPPDLPTTTLVARQGHLITALQEKMRRHDLGPPLLELPYADCTDDDATAFITHLTSLFDA